MSNSDCDSCSKEGLKPTDKCLRKNGSRKKGDKRIQRYQCRECGRFIPLGRFSTHQKMRRKSKIAQLPLSHFSQWEDYYTIQIASFISRLSERRIYDQLELLIGQRKETLASKISRSLPFSSYETCMDSLSYLEAMVIPSLEDKLKESHERSKLSNLKMKIAECCYEDFYGVPAPSLASLMVPKKENQHPFFVEIMLTHGVFCEFVTKIQVDKTGLFQKEVPSIMNEYFFEEYFFGK